eukprot:15457193-Alexandrium_andersonii.AAC.1
MSPAGRSLARPPRIRGPLAADQVLVGPERGDLELLVSGDGVGTVGNPGVVEPVEQVVQEGTQAVHPGHESEGTADRIGSAPRLVHE